MANQRIQLDEFKLLQLKTDNIRNFCILAHVDHGKTTLSDSLICSNGLISSKLAGKLRFLDSTEEEQKRGITMHSSAISLVFHGSDRGLADTTSESYLINLIDSPGHIDFSSDVSTATRLCDGALILIDVLEGLCTQTHAVVYKALKERMQPCLVLNKLDRLALEMKLSPTEAYRHLRRIIENVNALAYSLLTSELRACGGDETDNPLFDQWTFSPEKGNVIFASALDCWGFGIGRFSTMWAKKLEINKNILHKFMFEDYCYNATTKKLIKCDSMDSNSKPLFASLVLEPIWQLYDAAITNQDPAKAAKMAKRGLQVEIAARDVNTREPRMTIQAILRRWLPLADAILKMVVRCMPRPSAAQSMRISTLIQPDLPAIVNGNSNVSLVSQRIQRVNMGIACCAVEPLADGLPINQPDVVVFIAKMTPVRIAELSPRDIAMLQRRHDDKHRLLCAANHDNGDTTVAPPLDTQGEVLLALARVFSGVLRRDSNLYVLGNRHDPLQLDGLLASDEVLELDGAVPSCISTAKKIPPESIGMYIFLGPSVLPIDFAPAGNIVGILGLDEHVLKTATVASTWACRPLKAITFQAKPMVCVAVEPHSHQDLDKLEAGLLSLYQFDPVVEIGVDANGQHTMTCLGELHLELCLKTLEDRFAKCPIRASEPIVYFRETVLDRNEVVNSLPPPWSDIAGVKDSTSGRYRMVLPSCNLAIVFRAFALPRPVVQLLETDNNLVTRLNEVLSSNTRSDNSPDLSEELASHWSLFLSTLNHEDVRELDDSLQQTDLLKRIQGFGPKSNSSNLLVIAPEAHIDVWSGRLQQNASAAGTVSGEDASTQFSSCKISNIDLNSLKSHMFWKFWVWLSTSVMAGFQVCCESGPLMQEPLYGVGFAIEQLEVSVDAIRRCLTPEDCIEINIEAAGLQDHSAFNSQIAVISQGQLISSVKESLRLVLLSSPLRVVEPIYACDLQCDQSQLGNLYSVLSKRRGEVTKEDIIDGTSLFVLSATLPVTESFGFAQELLKKTSGRATAPQLFFSHWATLSLDPFWRPSTVEELEEYGDQVNEPNMTRALVDRIRKRKGLPIEEKVVASAEKQRNMNKKK